MNWAKKKKMWKRSNQQGPSFILYPEGTSHTPVLTIANVLPHKNGLCKELICSVSQMGEVGATKDSL